MSRETLSPKFHDVSFSRTIETVNHASAGKVAAPASSIVEEAPEYPRSARMLELAQRLGLDLADALARHRELLADLFLSTHVRRLHPDRLIVIAEESAGQTWAWRRLFHSPG